MGKKPGENSGPDGGIFQEQGPRGGKKPNYSTVPDNTIMPPTQTPGATWVPVKRTPDSKRK